MEQQSRSPLTPQQRAAWARVRILLNLGDVAGAEEAATSASAATDWDAVWIYSQFCGPEIYDSPEFPVGWVWYEPEENRALVATSVSTEFAMFGQLGAFVNRLEQLMTAPGFRRFDVESWRILMGEFDSDAESGV